MTENLLNVNFAGWTIVKSHDDDVARSLLIPIYPEIPVNEPIADGTTPAAAMMTVNVCSGTRAKYWQRTRMTENFLDGAVMFAGKTFHEKMVVMGEYFFGKRRFIAYRVWSHNEKKQEYAVDFVGWKYKWEHSSTCKLQEHPAPEVHNVPRHSQSNAVQSDSSLGGSRS